MKKIAPLFFVFCLILGAGVFMWAMRRRPQPTPSVAIKHPSVSAQKGPLKLTLTLYSETVPRNGPLWFRLSVANTSKKTFYINDPIFSRHFLRHGNDFIDYLGDNHDKKTGFYLVVIDAAGHELEQHVKPLLTDYNPCNGHYAWNEIIMSRSEMRKAKEETIIRNKIRRGRVVRPGQALETIPWSYHGFCGRRKAQSPPGHFAEFYELDLSEPGDYRVYAVLNDTPSEEVKKFFRKHRVPIPPSEVSIRTPLIRFEVLP
jgi:hypothetical protein